MQENKEEIKLGRRVLLSVGEDKQIYVVDSEFPVVIIQNDNIQSLSIKVSLGIEENKQSIIVQISPRTKLDKDSFLVTPKQRLVIKS